MASPPTLFKLQRIETSVGPVALVTMDNGEDWRKPNTFGEQALRSLEETLGQLRTRDWRGLLLTGKPFVFAVGADIGEFGEISPERAREGGAAGHELFGRLRDLPFVTVAAINGAALGGGVEIALHCDYRTISSDVRFFACPEVLLGLIPGWGGTQLIPQLVGAEEAVKFVVENPLRQNRMLNAKQAFEAGYADALYEPVEFLDESLAFLIAAIEEGAGKRRPAADLSDVVRGRPQGPLASRRSGARRHPGALPRARPHRGRRDVVARGRLPRGGGCARGPPARAAGAGIDLRVRPRRAPCEARSRRPRRGAATRAEARHRRSGADGPPARPARTPAPGGAGRPPRPHPGAGRRRQLLDPRRARRARPEGPPRRGEGPLPRLARLRRDELRRLRRLRPRAGGGLRGDEREEGGLRRAREGRRARDDPRHEHVVALDHRDGRRPRAPGAGRGHALLQPGRRAPARRARPHAADRRRDARHCVGGHEEAPQDAASSCATRPASSSTGCWAVRGRS